MVVNGMAELQGNGALTLDEQALAAIFSIANSREVDAWAFAEESVQ
jgi:hypothetical protein